MRTTWILNGLHDTTSTLYETWQDLADAHEEGVLAKMELDEPDPDYPIVTSWRCEATGEPVVVETTKRPSETLQEWKDRHFEEVREELEECPPALAS